MSTIVLAPPLARQAEEARAALPRTMAFPTESGFTDWSDADIGFYMASLNAGNLKVNLEPDHGDRVRGDVLPHHRYPNLVCVTWSIDVDVETGEIWANPRFSGLTASRAGSQERLDLQDLCTRLGMAEPYLLLTLGSLIQVGNPKDTDLLALNVLDLDPKIRELWIPLGRLHDFQESLRRAFKL